MENYSGIIALILYVIALVVFLRYQANHEEIDDEEPKKEIISKKTDVEPLNLDDEDATVASLIAAIECREEYKKNVQVISVRKVG